jgi:hypothetical protein
MNDMSKTPLPVEQEIVGEAPVDGERYGRINESWVPVTEEAPADGNSYVRVNGTWQLVAPAEGLDFGTGLTKDETATPPIVHLQPAGIAPQFLGGVWVPPRSPTQAADVATSGGDGQLVVPLATDQLAGSIVEPPPDGLIYSRTRTTGGASSWIEGTPIDAGIGLEMTGNTIDLQIANTNNEIGGVRITPRSVSQGLNLNTGLGILTAPLATESLAGSIVEPQNGTGQLWARTRTNAGVSSWTPVTSSIDLTYQGMWQPAPNVPNIGAIPAKANGDYWIVDCADPAVSETPPLGSTPGLDGVLLKEGDYAIWNDAAQLFNHVEVAIMNFGIGLDATGNTVNLQIANTLGEIGGVTVPVRDNNQGLTLSAAGVLTAPIAQGAFAGTLVEPPADGLQYARSRTTLSGDWTRILAEQLDFGTGLTRDTSTTPDIVHLQPAGIAAQFLGGVWVPPRSPTQGADVDTSGGDGRLVVPLATNLLAGSIVEPAPADGVQYARVNPAAGPPAWQPFVSEQLDFGTGLTKDTSTTPDIVHLQPAGIAPQFLGGVYVPPRSATQAADVDASGGDGMLVVPLATDLLAGAIVEPPPDDKHYARVRDLLGNSTWQEVIAAGGVIVSDTPPAAPVDDTIWFNSLTGDTYVRYNDGSSSQWVQINLPEAPLDGQAYIRKDAGWAVDTAAADFVKKVGDTMTGPLILPLPAPVADREATHKRYVDDLVATAVGVVLLVGVMDASTADAQCDFTLASGYPDGALPPATAVAAGHYVIVTVPGTPTTGPAAGITFAARDWLVSDGTAWVHLAIGGPATTASNVSVIPNVNGQTNVQDSLEDLSASKVDLAGDTMTGNLNFGTDGQGVLFSGGGAVYKIPGAGMVIRESSGGQQPQIENNDGTNRRDIIDTVNDFPRYDARYINTAGDTMAGGLTMNSYIVMANTQHFYLQSANSNNGVVTGQLIFRTPDSQKNADISGQKDGANAGTNESSVAFNLACGGWGYRRAILLQIASPPRAYFDGEVSCASLTNRSSREDKNSVRAVLPVEIDTDWAALNPVRFKLNDPSPPLDQDGVPLASPMPFPEQRMRYGFIAEDMAEDLVSYASPGTSDLTQAVPKVEGYDIAQVLALTVARMKQLEAEIEALKARQRG